MTMRISELIAELEKVKAEHGDIDVATYDPEGSVHDAVNFVEVEKPHIFYDDGDPSGMFGSDVVAYMGFMYD